MCTVVLPPGGNPIAVNKYIVSCKTSNAWQDDDEVHTHHVCTDVRVL